MFLMFTHDGMRVDETWLGWVGGRRGWGREREDVQETQPRIDMTKLINYLAGVTLAKQAARHFCQSLMLNI